MTLQSDVKFEEKLICCFKHDKHFVNFAILKICLCTCNSEDFHFDRFLLCKVYNV